MLLKPFTAPDIKELLLAMYPSKPRAKKSALAMVTASDTAAALATSLPGGVPEAVHPDITLRVLSPTQTLTPPVSITPCLMMYIAQKHTFPLHGLIDLSICGKEIGFALWSCHFMYIILFVCFIKSWGIFLPHVIKSCQAATICRPATLSAKFAWTRAARAGGPRPT
jgi:hypothetical protein